MKEAKTAFIQIVGRNLNEMENKPLIIIGSARKESDTRKCIDLLFSGIPSELIDLLDFNIYPYNYSGEYFNDDEFLNVMEKFSSHNIIIFSTPVYWYAMSGIMKIFFDRLTDIVTINKEIGRGLKGKKILGIAVGAEDLLPLGFEIPFKLTSEYFEMEFVGLLYFKSKNFKNINSSKEKIIEIIKTSANKV